MASIENQSGLVSQPLATAVVGVTPFVSKQVLDAVLEMTKDLFGENVSVKEEADPEIPGERYVVLDVVLRGDVREIVALDQEWHRRLLGTVAENPQGFRLSIEPK